MGTPVLSRKADWRIDLSDRPELGMIDLDNGTPVLKIGIGQSLPHSSHGSAWDQASQSCDPFFSGFSKKVLLHSRDYFIPILHPGSKIRKPRIRCH